LSSMLLFVALAIGAVVVLCHLAPFHFLLDAASGGVAIWEGPHERAGQKVLYLTFDDGPNPTATPELLDALREKSVSATFFVIDAFVHEGTAPILRRAFAEGHAVALHSGDRWLMLKSPDGLTDVLESAAARVQRYGGGRPCRLFRPHAGWRSHSMIRGLRQSNYRRRPARPRLRARAAVRAGRLAGAERWLLQAVAHGPSATVRRSQVRNSCPPKIILE